MRRFRSEKRLNSLSGAADPQLMRILVADDDRMARTILQDLLTSWGHEVVQAADGFEAWTLLQEDVDFSLLISDWIMPEMDGIELCRHVRARDSARYLPIILASSLGETDHLIQGLEAGADAFITKPVDPGTLRAQMCAARRVVELETSLHAEVERLEEANTRIQRDLEAAAAVQRSHLPSESPELPAAQFAWVYDACEAIGGDMFNVFRLDENHVGLYVLDVSGHGTSAALLSMSLSRVLVPFPQQGGILKRRTNCPPYYEIVPPAQVAADLNERFQMIQESGRFCTFLYGVLHLPSHLFRYVSAGHPGPIEATQSGPLCHDGVGGIPIGVEPGASWEEEQIQLAPGSQLIFTTDGVFEARNRNGEEFGQSRILGVLDGANEDANIEGTVHGLHKCMLDFAEGEAPHDDVTIVGVGLL
jgi:sigma-B regulation protein RsbU (phosphoserine phosphatase)